MEKTTIAINGNFLAKPYSGCGQYTQEFLLATHHQPTMTVFFNSRLAQYSNQNHKIQEIQTLYSRRDQLQQLLFEQKIGTIADKTANILFSPYHSTTTTHIPHIMTIHDAIGYIPKWNQKPSHMSRLYKSLANRAALRAAHIMTVSNYAKRQIQKYIKIPEKKISVIYPGINHDIYYQYSENEIEAMKKKYQLPQTYVVYVGGFEERKNVNLLLDILPSIQEQLVIIGNPPREFQNRLSTSPAHTLLRLDVTDQDKAKILSGAKLFLWPSLEEGFGIPPLEAMACGTPVVANRLSAMPEILGEAAIWCKPETTSWIQTITNLQKNQLETKRLDGIQKASTYSWNQTTKQILHTLEQYT